MISFLKIQAQLQRSYPLTQYMQNSKLIKRLGVDFRIELSFGLHLGWAVEGAIGSHFKFDASYLSPNVNLAARIQSATKFFGVPLLMSGNLVKHFCKETQDYCRQLDRVLLKGSREPIDLYTLDTVTDFIMPDDAEKPITYREEKKRRARQRLSRDKYKQYIFSGEI